MTTGVNVFDAYHEFSMRTYKPGSTDGPWISDRDGWSRNNVENSPEEAAAS